MNSKNIQLKVIIDEIEIFTQKETDNNLPFESDYYNINNEHSLTSKDDNNYPNKPLEKNEVLMTENKEAIIKINSSHEKSSFSIKKEPEEFFDLKGINNSILSTQKNTSSKQVSKEQNDIFHQTQETIYLIDGLKNLNDINDISNIDKIIQNVKLNFERIEEKIKIKYKSLYDDNSISDISNDLKIIFDLISKKSELSKKLKESLVSLKELELYYKCIDNTFSINADKGEKENYQSDEKIDKIEYENNTFKNENNQLLSKKKLINNKKNKKLKKAEYNPITPNSNSRHEKRGRISNKDKEKGFIAIIDNNNRTDNMRKKIYHLFFKSIDRYIHILIEKINEKENKNYIIFHAVINNDNIKDIDSIKKLFQKSILDVLLESVPRRGKIENINKNNEKIKEIINNCHKYGTEGKILYNIFYKIFKDLLLMYLNNEKSIVDESTKKIINLDDFKTFDDDFINYDEKTKNKYKRKALQLNPRKKKKVIIDLL